MLLNSQVVCSAVKRCRSKSPQSIPGKDINRELFPASDKDRYRKDYYGSQQLIKGRNYQQAKKIINSVK